NLGLLELDAAGPEKALPILERAQNLRHAHNSSADAATCDFQRDLGMGYYNIALARKQSGDAPAAAADFLKAVAAFEQVARLEPNDLGNRHRLAICRRLIGDVKADNDETEEAVDLYDQARDEL